MGKTGGAPQLHTRGKNIVHNTCIVIQNSNTSISFSVGASYIQKGNTGNQSNEFSNSDDDDDDGSDPNGATNSSSSDACDHIYTNNMNAGYGGLVIYTLF
ncbi:unnamed protein product [Lactuca saligna]|uniref:Uncharacterized protein n=1 Tax=Lactuca saligna TaxID=75948 RepID=A0AA35ZWZ3_LACSI|nr:unnamed protein product [Lactuca saligna]